MCVRGTGTGYSHVLQGFPHFLELGEGARGVRYAGRGLQLHGQRPPAIALEMEQHLHTDTNNDIVNERKGKAKCGATIGVDQ